MWQMSLVRWVLRCRQLDAVCFSLQGNKAILRQISSEGQFDDVLSDTEQNKYLREICSIPDCGHQVFVIQPQVKTGPNRVSHLKAELKLDENCALVETLPRWNVVNKAVVPLKTPVASQIFPPGAFTRLTQLITSRPDISAVLLGVDRLKSDEFLKLQQAWAVPVFDRYTIVLQIFKDHAKSKEAKLQVALAEIPYIRSRLSQIEMGSYDQQTGGVQFAGGTGDTFITVRRQLIQERESKLKRILRDLKNQRGLLRRNRQRKQIPSVAVVGYTNAGKTTVIKALTGDSGLTPRNQLFATLDVTAHAGFLPNRMMAVFIDTVGFISDIPLDLINAFSATLEDAVLADVIVHVRDISHPDSAAQCDDVIRTLKTMLSPTQMANIIEVCNKADLLTCNHANNFHNDSFLVSATSGQGLSDLRNEIQDVLIQSTGQLEKTFRIPMDGEHLSWLYKEATVKSAEPDSDSEHLLVSVVISTAAYARFKSQFSTNREK
ncbi:putative GTP-binding protein 6 [Gigantopelta aegis]|uniref:putative GTP-binding protein 6 n=1 Tax=Gigantopelta aegis TaxID=1735272 RepID=UPI001B88DF04|nr:putative GTP-binding protein 6 [Gigantopelta aegis]XP_041350428.1 putative GTP-binding protein 6 [Gigantopelta aegis]XP_041350429.1 putative GTP-binding protein 6 [Gigantopelta aegis]XP_041350430.1 putative GTP-binding protein 6 [Gigantopelta aegis]